MAKLFTSLKNKLQKTSKALGLGLFFKGKTLDEEFIEDLEDKLLLSDLGPAFVTDLIDQLTEVFESGEIKDSDEVVRWLRAKLFEAIHVEEKEKDSAQQPSVWFFLGVNGVGKTTTLGKLAVRLVERKFSVLLAAGDTFRAAAGEQLQLWAERAKSQVVRHREGGDPSAVIFDAYDAAMNRKTDFLLVDTAGRLHNKKNLMSECEKMVKTIERKGGKIEEIFLVVDATTGQNAVQQAKLFSEIAPLSGIILTKMDGSAKGGIAFQLVQTTQTPIRYLGLGEGMGDLEEFDAKTFIDSILPEDAG